MTRAAVRWLAIALVLGAVVTFVVVRPYRGARGSSSRLLVYEAVGREFLIVDVDTLNVTRIACRELPRWMVRVGRFEGTQQLVALDTEVPAIVRIDLARLRDARDCAGALRRTPIASRHVPYQAALLGDRLFVSFFGEEELAIFDQLATEPRLVRTVAVGGQGASAVAARGSDEIVVASAGVVCRQRECPNGRYGDATLARWSDKTQSLATIATLTQPQNGAGLYRHPSGGAVFWLFAGDIEGGGAAIVPLDGAGLPRAPVPILPRGVSAWSGRALSASLAAVLGVSGPHVTIFDVRSSAIAAVWRFEDHRFVDVTSQRAVEERSDADLQDMIALDTVDGGRFFFVDARGARLIEAKVVAPARLEVVREIALGPAARDGAEDAAALGPAWAEWL